MNNNPTITPQIVHSPFNNFCMSIGAIPSSYKDSLDYYETLLWLIKFLDETVIPAVDTNGNAIAELQTFYLQLQDYVNHYFDNLDLQEDINNKLDEMVEDGTMASIINEEIFNNLQTQINENKKYKSKFSMICMKESGSGNCYIVEFANGKNMFIDTGSAVDWTHIVYTLNQMNITYFDYGIITHPHSDHVGNLQNFITNYCDENTIFYTGATPDFTKIPNEQTNYENMASIFILNNITPVVPTNNSVITIDELSKTSIRFLNTDTNWFDDYYYPNAIGEYRTDSQTANVLSLVTEIIFDNTKILETADIEKCVEDKLVDYVTKVDIMTAPHHFDNKHINEDFYNILNPDTVFVCTPNGALAYGNIGYSKMTIENKNIISSYDTDSNYISAVTYGYNFKYENANYKALYFPKQYNDIGSLISSVHYIGVEGYANISFNIIKNSMKIGDVLYTNLKNNFTQLISDLESIFDITIPVNSTIEINKFSNNDYSIKLHRAYRSLILEANTYNNGTNWYVCGSGVAGSWSTEAELLNLINSVPVGVYSIYYSGNEEHTLGATGHYQTLNINQIAGANNYRKGTIESLAINTNFSAYLCNFNGAANGFSWKQITLS